MKHSCLFIFATATMLAACGDSQGPNDYIPPLRNRIVFVSNRDGANQLYSMKPDGSDIRMIPAGVSGVVQSPVVSPDGRKIALRLNGAIHVVNSDGTGLKSLLMDGFPSWSPDGAHLAFDNSQSGNDDIYVMAADGTGLRRVTTDSADDRAPSWSPDGSRIAFHTNRTGTFEIFTIAADGSDPANLTQALGGSSPSWGPDGRIAFLSNRNTFTLQLFVMEPDGSGVVQITSISSNAHLASWSPDSRSLVFGCYSTFEICTLNDDGTGLTSVTGGPENDEWPTWSP